MIVQTLSCDKCGVVWEGEFCGHGYRAMRQQAKVDGWMTVRGDHGFYRDYCPQHPNGHDRRADGTIVIDHTREDWREIK